MNEDVRFKLFLDDYFSSKIKKAEKRTSAFGSAVKRVGGMMLAAFAGGAILRALDGMVKEYDKSEQAIAQVKAGIIATGNAAGMSLDQLTQAATEMQRKTIFGDETILKDVTAQLLTFTNITEKNFNRAQMAVLDVSTRIGTEAKSTAIQLGKALHDPILGLTMLSRSGIQFSKDQKATIKSMVETNNLVGAQTLMLAEIERQYGGSAEAARKAGTGGIKGLKNAFGDLQEVIGGGLAKTLTSGNSLFTELIENTTDFLKVPVSQELRKQKVLFNIYAKELKESNVPFSRKLELIKKVQSIYPGYLKNVGSEEELQKRIGKETETANKHFETRIKLAAVRELISLKQLEIQRLVADSEEFRNKQAELLTEMSEERKFNTRKSWVLKTINMWDDLMPDFMMKESLSLFYGDRTKGEAAFLKYKSDLAKVNEIAAKSTEKQSLNALEGFEKQKAKADEIAKKIEGIVKGSGFGAGGEDGAGGDLAKAGITKITAAAPKTFNVNIGKLIEEFNINTATVKEGAVKAKEIVLQALMSAIADTQIQAE